MGRGSRRPSPALLISCIALFAALGGTVYAANSIDGSSIEIKSLPGNRLMPGSLPGNRLQAGAIPGSRLAPGSLTGNQIDAATLDQVPSAVHADTADSAHDAETALNAVNAIDAQRVNGHSAGCALETILFAGACWQTSISKAAVTAPAAALACATQGGELPDALSLAAFSQQPGVTLDAGDEWTGDIPVVSGTDLYAVVTVSATGALKAVVSSAAKKYRCVIPLLG
jgi:hypothetical protein